MEFQKQFLRRMAAALLSFVIAFTFVQWEKPLHVKAESEAAYANRCFDSMTTFANAKTGLKRKAWAYLAGTNDIVRPSWYQDYEVCDLYTVDPDTEIQGKTVDKKWLPQDNKQYLKTIVEKYLKSNALVNKISSKPDNWAGTQREGAKFAVVDYDEDWVTVWDDGFQIWNVEAASQNAVVLGCTYGPDAYMETHPAGFYKLRRKDVWIDFGLSGNHPYKSKDEIPEAGSGVVTKLVYLRPVPNEKEKVYTPVYTLPQGTKLNVVSEELVDSEADGSTHKFYRVSFNGSSKVQNNAVYYMTYKVPGMYYIDSRYLNFTKKGAKKLPGAVEGEIMNVESSASVYAYASKSTGAERVAVMTRGTAIDMLPAESDGNWTTVIFSGKKAYVQTKFIGGSVKDISTPYLADIVDGQFVIKWNPGKNNVDYSVTLTSLKLQKGKQTELWSNPHYKSNKLTVDRKYMKSGGDFRVTVQANGSNNKKGKTYYRQIKFPATSGLTLKERYVTPGKNSFRIKCALRSVQYSTDKNFKNAKTVEKTEKKDGKINQAYVKVIKNLKSNTTYYLRYRGMEKYKTTAGEKWIGGVWSSNPVKVKTKP